MSDTPTTNWCTLNPLTLSNGTLSNGNLRFQPSGNNATAWSTFAVNSGKWYWEVTKDSGDMALMLAQNARSNGYQSGGDETGLTCFMYYSSGGTSTNRFQYNATNYAFPSGFGDDTNGNIYSFMLDFDAGTFKVRRNNDSGTEASFTMPSALTANPLHIGYSVTSTWPSGDFTYNFGQRAFAYTPPTGYKALSTGNLPAPTIKDGSSYFNTVLYTGIGGPQSVTGIGFQPDFAWFKRRNSAAEHGLHDAVRGVRYSLSSDTTGAELDRPTYVTSFDADGFTFGDNVSNYNASGSTYVAWNWKANGAGSSNNAGTITSTVSANASAGFSIVSYTGNGTSGATIGHGLGVSPSMIVVKLRETATDGSNKDWAVYHTGVDASSPQNYVLTLNSSAGRTTSAGSWNNTAPSSTVFTVGSNFTVNNSGKDYVAYCFSEVAGYSKFGKYAGNSSSDGSFVFLGFRPAYLLIVGTTSGSWQIYDTKRMQFNPGGSSVSGLQLEANNATNPSGNMEIDLLSNGFKCRTSDSTVNFSGREYVYAAFAEHPFKYANAR